MPQSQLNQYLNQYLNDLTVRVFPDESQMVDVPFLVALPSGIHPYNKVSAYYDLTANAVVLYQQRGCDALHMALQKKPSVSLEVHNTLIHELAHWYQFNFLLDGNPIPEGKVHSHHTWSEACHLITSRLIKKSPYDLNHFKPLISKREGKNIVKAKRENALTLVELHAFPRSIQEFTQKKR